MKFKKIIFGTTILAAFFILVIFVSCSSGYDLKKAKDAYIKDLTEKTSTKKYDGKSAQDIKNDLAMQEIAGQTTYYFKDIDYKFDNNRSKWPAATHLSNTLALTVLSQKSNDQDIKDIAIGLTYYWVYNNFKNTNWWQNDLSANTTLSSIALFLSDDLSDKGLSALKGKVHNATFHYNETLKEHSGANLFDYSDISLKCALFENDQKQFDEVYNRICDELVEGKFEGFQTDGSFFQHGKQIQIASYGKGVVRLGNVAKMISTSGKDLPADKLKVISNYILNGLKHTIHKGNINYAAIGREYTRPDSLDAKTLNCKQFSNYLDIPSFPDKEELKQFIEDVDNKRPTFDGIYYYDVANFITMNIDGVYMSFKGTDEIMNNTECVNDENQLGLNMTYATNTTVLDQGDEYLNICPLWQYDSLPGTTSYNIDPDKEEKQLTEIAQRKDLYHDNLLNTGLPAPDADGKYVYSGGYDKNNNVACRMEKTTHHNENKLTVTCFACEDGMVIVGSDFAYTGEVTGPGKYFDANRSLHTTIEQCNYKGSHNLSSDAKQLTHGNVIYKILDNNKIDVQTQDVSGMWQKNNPSLTKPLVPATGNTLLARINYNSNIAKSYAYSIQPKTRTDKNFELIDTGDSLVHAVKLPNGKIVVAFYKDGSFNYNGKTFDGNKGEFKVF